jgi:hypothetical protein
MEPQNRSPFMRKEKPGYSSLHSNKIKVVPIAHQINHPETVGRHDQTQGAEE